jgi:hypothetical protein
MKHSATFCAFIHRHNLWSSAQADKVFVSTLSGHWDLETEGYPVFLQPTSKASLFCTNKYPLANRKTGIVYGGDSVRR